MTSKFVKIDVDLSERPVQLFSVTSDEAGCDPVYFFNLEKLSHAFAKVSDSRGRRFLDRLWSLGGDKIISPKFVEILSQFRSVDGFRFVPLTLTGSIANNEYFALATPRLDALDRERSQIAYYRSTPNAIKQINHLVLKPSVVANLDWFITEQGDFIVSDPVVANLERHKISGVCYVPVET